MAKSKLDKMTTDELLQVWEEKKTEEILDEAFSGRVNVHLEQSWENPGQLEVNVYRVDDGGSHEKVIIEKEFVLLNEFMFYADFQYGSRPAEYWLKWEEQFKKLAEITHKLGTRRPTFEPNDKTVLDEESRKFLDALDK